MSGLTVGTMYDFHVRARNRKVPLREAMLFTLDVATDPAARRATLRLRDDAARFLAAHDVDLAAHLPGQWDAAFETRTHVRRMARSMPPEEQLANLGNFLGANVLGPDIARLLAEGVQARLLLVRVHCGGWASWISLRRKRWARRRRA